MSFVVVGSASKNKDQKTPIIQPIACISIQAPACPNCHGEMVQRMAKKRYETRSSVLWLSSISKMSRCG